MLARCVPSLTLSMPPRRIAGVGRRLHLRKHQAALERSGDRGGAEVTDLDCLET
jgi:hypothetical protein